MEQARIFLLMQMLACKALLTTIDSGEVTSEKFFQEVEKIKTKFNLDEEAGLILLVQSSLLLSQILQLVEE